MRKEYSYGSVNGIGKFYPSQETEEMKTRDQANTLIKQTEKLDTKDQYDNGTYMRKDGRIYTLTKEGLVLNGNNFATYNYHDSIKLLSNKKEFSSVSQPLDTHL